MRPLSDRLLAVARLAGSGKRGVDVGCDHGYLSIYLVRNGYFDGMIAMDVRKGPLDSAVKNIKAEGLEEKIECRLSNGLEKFRPGEADTLILAGMGGALMQEILTADREKTGAFEKLVLQPQSLIPEFRAFLREEGYEAAAEDMIFEDGKFYPMMAVIKGSRKPETDLKLADAYGELLLKQRPAVLTDYLHKERKTLLEIRESLKKSSCTGRETEIEEKLLLNARALKEVHDEA